MGGRHGQLLDAWGMSADHPDALVAPAALPSRAIPWYVLCVDRYLHMAHCAGAAGALPSVRKYPPPLAASLDSRPTHWSVQTYRWKRAGGRSIQISEPEYHSGRLSRNSSRACCSHCAAGVA